MALRRGTGVARSPRSTELSHSLPELTRSTLNCYAITLILSVRKPRVKVVSVKWASCKTFVFLPVGAAMSYHFFIQSRRNATFLKCYVRLSRNQRFLFRIFGLNPSSVALGYIFAQTSLRWEIGSIYFIVF